MKTKMPETKITAFSFPSEVDNAVLSFLSIHFTFTP
jgi:hypothetical protein